MTRRFRAAVTVAPVVASALAITACTDEGDDDLPSGLSDDALRGAELADDNGCSACHRSGGIGPAWEGLYGSTVELDDGTTVVADEEYVTRSITDPDADIVAGYDVRMPGNDLADDEVADLVAYIRELGGPSQTTHGGG